MSSGDLNINPTQIPLPPSEVGSVQENEPTNVPEAAPSPPMLTENAEEDEKRELAELFLRMVAWQDPYIPDPYLIPGEPTETVDEEKKPTRTESWERMLKEVARHDEDMVKGWRDDIDTLLVFAGLFSAVVTAFVIESYQWLEEDPADTTVALLTQLVSVQVNGSQATSFEPTPFKPDASSVRINVFWFLSLILSLTSALFGLLCKQWVREHQRDTTNPYTRRSSSTPSASPRQFREVGRIVVFVGASNSSRSRSSALLRSSRSTDDINSRHFDRLSYQFICPYKSPQAWLVYRLSSALLRPLLKITAIDDFLRGKVRCFWDHIKSPASDWSSFDLWVVRQFDQHIWVPFVVDYFDLKVYELRAFEWAVTMFRDSPSMIPHLQNILGTIPPSVAVSAVLHRWDRAMWRTASMRDVEDDLRFSQPDPSLNPTIRHPIFQQPEGIKLLFHHQYWAETVARHFPHDAGIDKLIDSMKRADLQHSTGLRFAIPFPLVDALWTHENPTVRAKSLTLLSLFEQSWKPCSGYDERRHNDERRAFVEALANHINRQGRISELLTSKRGQTFIRFIHNEILTRRLFRYHPINYVWPPAIRRAQEVGGLPSDYFAPIFGLRDGPPTLPNLDPIRYSIETKRDVQVHNNEVLDIVTLNGVGDPTGVGPSEGGHVHYPQNYSAHDVDINNILSLGSRVSGSSGNMIQDHESGVNIAGRPMGNQEGYTADHDSSYTGVDSAQRGDTIESSSAAKPTDTGTSRDSSGQVGDIAGNTYSLHRNVLN
ncbi:hypothetical protein Moror_1968 [Moniliophthora roreri MCA 2997]|uniref:DUF6535 domain-containing protein n=1 Tax=Moniliophthora roreri (strain MCA 2997) TaxID=1381753 RepID=V2Y7D5_MONRO|nr:hypothetical protein Moror_1968 [Moniliophthora roreri MCA 2997]